MSLEMKRMLLEAVVAALEAELCRLQGAHLHSSEGANNTPVPGSQRDTTGLEAAYLASGYASQCNALIRQIAELKQQDVEDFTGQEIDVGALVEVEVSGENDFYLILPVGGGTEVCITEKTVTVITPESPLGSALMGNVEAGMFTLRPEWEGIILDVC